MLKIYSKEHSCQLSSNPKRRTAVHCSPPLDTDNGLFLWLSLGDRCFFPQSWKWKTHSGRKWRIRQEVEDQTGSRDETGSGGWALRQKVGRFSSGENKEPWERTFKHCHSGFLLIEPVYHWITPQGHPPGDHCHPGASLLRVDGWTKNNSQLKKVSKYERQRPK